MKKLKHLKLRHSICVSGAAEIEGVCSDSAKQRAFEIGEQIAKKNLILTTGATTGIPYLSAQGAKKAGGIVIGFSPAASKAAHLKVYRLPIDYHDIIVYTGFGYSGRNLFLTRASDAVIVICGRMGTLNEFTIAFEDNKPIGVLEGTGGTADKIKKLVEKAYHEPGKIVYDKDPAKLLNKVLKIIDEKN